ncbi:MAG: TonB-dependent receptor [Pseudomonadota bacterium]
MKKRSSPVSPCNSAALLLLGASLVPPSTAQVLEEVTVTAQKKAENLQDVPIAVTAFSTDQLDSIGFDEIADLAFLSPSVQFGTYGPVAYANIRGIGNENTTAGGDPGVALHIDNVYIGRPLGTLFSAFDSERVEILRGPQGTLYGRNATGGSINYLTKKPGMEPGGELDVTLGDYNWIRTRAAVNVPFTDAIQGRFVVMNEDRDGFTENSVPGGSEGNDRDNMGFRSHLAINVSDTADLLLSAHVVENGGVGSQPELREAFPQPLAGPPVPGSIDYILDGVQLVNDLRPFREAKDLRESQQNELYLYSAQLTWDVGNVTVKSITAYVETSFDSMLDLDSSEKRLADLRLTQDSEQISQEFQFIGGSDRTSWIAGLYYFEEDASRRSSFFGSRFDILAEINNVPSGFDVGGVVSATSLAFFGEVTQELSDSLRITAGARYTDDEKGGTNSGSQFSPAYTGSFSDSWQETTWRVNATWDVFDSSMLFATVSTGYKSGGVNQVTNPEAGGNPIYDPETVTAYEIGYKSRLLNGRVQLNTSLYRNDYEELQFQVFLFAGPESFNASGATVQGLEVELQAALTDTLFLDASLGITDSEFEDQLIPVGGPNTVQIGGNQVQRTPDLTYSLSLTKEWDLPSKGTLSARLDYAYTDEIFYTAFNRTGGFSDPGGSDLANDYTNVDLRVTWTSPGASWLVEAAATNLTDEVQEGNVFRDIGFHDIPGGGGLERVSYNAPRILSLRVGYNF